MSQILSDKFITSLTGNIRGLFDMVRKLSQHQAEQDKKIAELAARVERAELVWYNVGEAFKDDNHP